MDKPVISLVLVLFAVIVLFALSLVRITGLFVGFRQPAEGYEWWNVSWRYRVELRINSTSYNRKDWPVEYKINFTDLLPSGNFDVDSVRVIEYNSTGQPVQEVSSQFDQASDFDATDNALGEVVFIMNGTTPQNTNRMFFIYYDTTDNGPKEQTNYPTGLAYAFNENNGEFHINNTVFDFWMDSIRSENSSGIIRIRGLSSQADVFTIELYPPEAGRTYEYTKFSNGTHNFTFDFTHNATLKYNGSVRMVVEQRGDEVIWNSTTQTNEGYGVKRYIFYDNIPWIKIEVNFTNIGGSTITRNSTFVGPISLDAARAFGSNWQSGYGNTTPPGWWWAADYYGNTHAGIIHINQTGTTNFWVPSSSSKDKIGIKLNSTYIDSGDSIIEYAAMHFNDTFGNDTQVEELRDRLAQPPQIVLELPEHWYVSVLAWTNATIYNRNETALIIGNLSATDPYNLTEYINATLDMGTPSTADDQTLILYDDGLHEDYDANDKIYASTFNISNDATVGIWTINFTTYDENLDLLNYTIYEFNVTDVFNVTVNITNDAPVGNTIVFGNVYVRNYDTTAWIVNAIVNCSYDSAEVINITDLQNGTYSINFTAPDIEDTYILTCNATKNGNFGEGNDTFTTQPPNTSVAITAQPSNPSVYAVSLYNNDSFVINVNATVVTNGTALDANMTLELLSGWAGNATINGIVEPCGDMGSYISCIKGFNITVPNGTGPGNYSINVSIIWGNADYTNSTNKTEVNVTVQSNPLIDVEEGNVTGEGADGTTIVVGNFTVLSVGNDQIENISFSCQSGDVCNNFAVGFMPENISSISAGYDQNVSINVTISLAYAPGMYNGIVNVSADNDNSSTFTVYVTVPTKTNVSITPSITDYMSYGVTQDDNESFSFHTNLTDVKNGSARYTNVSLSYNPGWYSNSSFESCGNLTKDEICTQHFSVTIPAGTSPGNYYVNITANWTNTDNSLGTNMTSLPVTVIGNPQINVSKTNITGNTSDGTNTSLGNFTVLSIGNEDLQNIAFNCYAGTGAVCDNFTLYLNPSAISTLAVGENETVTINVSIPLSFPAGDYNGTLNISAENDDYKNLTLFVTVLENRTWNVTPTKCERSTQQPEGTVCDVNVTNLGNIIINFTVSPAQGNYTEVNETSFNISREEWHVFEITYNVTGQPPGTYNSSFLVDAIQSNSNPDNVTIKASLVPYIAPIINISVQPNETAQNTTVIILANVTSQSGYNIEWVRLNVTRPGSYVDSFDMFFVDTVGNATRWEFTYPNSTNDDNGSTHEKGTYNVTVYASDTIGNIGHENKTLLVYINLSISATTLTNVYYQGDTATIYYIARDIDRNGVINVTTSFIVYDSQGNITYISSNFTTNGYGTIYPAPIFGLTSDAPLGDYTLNSQSSYYDSITNKTLEVQKNYTFEVYSRTVTVTGIFADLETAVVWYPPLPGYPTPIIRFGILIYNGEGAPVDPDYMNLSLYKPDGHLCFSDTMANMDKEATGYYTYQRSFICTDLITPTGMYLAVLNATQTSFETLKLKAFRVAQGGPYDIRLNLLENEVEQGDVLDYVIVIENKGEVTQDVFVEYWISPIGQNRTDAYWSEWVLTPALTDQSFTRTLEIPLGQPIGNHLMWARVSYDATQPSLVVNSSFTVLTRVSPPTTRPPSYPPYPYYPTGAVPAPRPTEEIQAGIMITKYKRNISLARDVTIIESVVVNNTGQIDLNNVSLFIIGVPTTWFNITPQVYKTLPEGESTVFVITFRAPKNAEATTFDASLLATSGVVSDEKVVKITVFKSLEELLREELRRLKIELQELEVDTKVAKIEDKDTSNVELLIEEIKLQLSLAEDNIERGNLEEASSNLGNARNLLEKAKDLLDKLEIMKVRIFLPLWIIIAIIITLALIVFVIVFLRRAKAKKKLRPWIIPFGKVADSVKGKKITKEDLLREKERIERMLNILEREKEEGIISVAAHKEMRKSLESKLEKLEKKLK